MYVSYYAIQPGQYKLGMVNTQEYALQPQMTWVKAYIQPYTSWKWPAHFIHRYVLHSSYNLEIQVNTPLNEYALGP